MNKNSSLFDVNILSTRCCSWIRLVKYYILLWLVVNAIGTFGDGELDRNYHSEGKNKKVFMMKLLELIRVRISWKTGPSMISAEMFS